MSDFVHDAKIDLNFSFHIKSNAGNTGTSEMFCTEKQ